jgi:hypothetical protein
LATLVVGRGFARPVAEPHLDVVRSMTASADFVLGWDFPPLDDDDGPTS